MAAAGRAEATSKSLSRPDNGAVSQPGAGRGNGEGDSGDSRPETVDVAVWPMMIRDIDIKSNTYLMRAYVTFVWKGAIDPTETVDFMNSVNTSSLRKVNGFSKPVMLPDGRSYQWLCIEGCFFVPFDLRCFPLDHHTLSLSLEDTTYSSKKILYRFNSADSGIEPGLSIPGWSVGKWSGKSSIHSYHQDASASIVGSEFSTLEFQVQVSRPANMFIYRMLLPSLIILIFSWAALYLHPKLIASRLAITGSSLMVTFIFQLAYFFNLPGVGYLVLMDKVFAILYLLIIATLVQVILIERREKKNVADEYKFARRLDKAGIVVQAFVFFCYLTCVILTAR